MKEYHSPLTCSSRLDSVRHGTKSSAVTSAKRAVSQVAATTSAVPKRPEPGSPEPSAVIVEDAPIEAREKKKDASKPRFDAKDKKVNSKIPHSGVMRKKDQQMTSHSALNRPKSSVSTRSIGEGGTEAKTRKKNEPKSVPPAVQRASQSTNSGAEIQIRPSKRVAVRAGGATQPTLSQLAPMKPPHEEQKRRAVPNESTKP